MARNALPRLETLRDPELYAYEQVMRAGRIAVIINRGRFILLEEPWA